MKSLETKNLKLRAFKAEDAEEIYESITKGEMLDNDWIKDINNTNIDEIRMLVDSLISGSEEGEPTWVLQEKETGKLFGYVTSNERTKNNKLCVIVANTADCSKKGREYAKEALEEICDYLLFEEDFEAIYTRVYDKNPRVTQIKCDIFEKIGMKKDEEIKYVRFNKDTKKSENLYCIKKENLENKQNKKYAN